MASNRRDFIKATTALSVLGASDALAAQRRATPVTPWIGFLHSTALEFELEQAFLDGLRQQNWEGDPTLPLGGRSPVIIRKINGNGRYRATNFSDLKQAADNLRDNTPNLKLLVAAGGLVSGLAAVQGAGVPILVVLGRANQSLAQSTNPRVGGYFFDYPIGATQNQNMINKINYLTGRYSVLLGKMCLLYNGNSNMGSTELKDWLAANPNGKYVDASRVGADENSKIDFKRAFDDANALLGGDGVRAIVVSADPFFSLKRARFLRLAQRAKPGLVMCYPLTEYFEDAVDPEIDDRRSVMSYGPRLLDVYTNLGVMAGQILTNPATPLSITRAPSSYNGL